MAAPHVAGVVSLMKGLNPSLTPAQVANILESTARDFPSYAGCDTATCGEGIVDAFKALEAVQPPPADFMSYIPAVFNLGSPPPPPPASLINGAFEQGPGVGWAESSTNDFALVLDDFETSGGGQAIVPHGGSWAVWLGGWENEISVLSQQITVNAGMPFLTYYHIISSDEGTCDNDAAGVDINGATVKAYDLCAATETGDWVKQSINVAAYAGQTVLLEFWAQTDGNLDLSSLFLDDVAFAASAAAAAPQETGPVGANASPQRAAK
jgi:hypothetical protein